MKKAKAYLSILLALFSITCHGQNPEPPSWTRKIDEVVEQITIENGPGGVIAVAKGEDILYSKAFGYADVAGKRLNTVNTLFDIASCSKQFTAACVLQLAAQEKINLDNPIQEYIPGFNIKTPIPVHSLLTHSSGLQDYSELLLLARGREEVSTYSGKDIFKTILQQTDLSFDPGTAENYSNTNYAMLAKLVESVSNLSFPKYLKKNMFDPLNLNSNNIHLSELDLNSDYSRGYPSRVEGVEEFTPEQVPEASKNDSPDDVQMHGAGGIRANITGLVKWMNAYTKGQIGNSTVPMDIILEKDTLANGTITDYARGGLKTGITSSGIKWVQHTGRSNSTSIMMWLPDYDIFIMALFNTQEIWGQSVTNKFYKDILESMPRVVDEKADANESTNKASEESREAPFVEQPEVELSHEQLQKFVGIYPADAPVGSHTPPSGGVGVDRIVLDEGKLKYVLYNGYEISLKPISATTLEMTGIGRPIQLRFNNLESDKPSVNVADPLVDNGNPGETIYQIPEMPKAKLKQYCGKYLSPTLINSIPVEIIEENGELFFQWGILKKRAKLYYLGKDRLSAWQSGNNSGMQCNLVIRRNSKGKIIGLSYEGHRVWNLFFNKL